MRIGCERVHHQQSLFGLSIVSNHALSGVKCRRAADPLTADLWVTLEPLASLPLAIVARAWQPYAPGQTNEPGYRIFAANAADGQWYRLVFTNNLKQLTYIINPAADRLWGGWDYPPGGDEPGLYAVTSLFHSRVLSIVLNLRGILCLHGAAVAYRHAALAILGDAGAGKSTLAAALLERGCRLLADDKVALHNESDGWCVAPGVPALKLWPDTLCEMQRDPQELDAVLYRNPKRVLPVASVAVAPRPLRALYIIDASAPADAQLALEPVRPAAGLFQLLNQRLGASIRTRDQLAGDMARLRTLAQETPIRLIRRPRTYQSIPSTVDAILADFQQITAAPDRWL